MTSEDSMTPNLKKQLAQIYSEVNQAIYISGVHQQKIEILENKILIYAQTLS